MSFKCYQPNIYTHVDQTWSHHHPQVSLPGPLSMAINRVERTGEQAGKAIATNTVAAARFITRELHKTLPSGDPGNPFTKSVQRFVQADLNLLEDFMIDVIKIGISNVEGLIRSILCTFGLSVQWRKLKWYIACPFPYAAAGILCGTMATVTGR